MLFTKRREDGSQVDNVVNFLLFYYFFIGLFVSDIELVVLAIELRIVFDEISGNNLRLAKIIYQGLSQSTAYLTSASSNEELFVVLQRVIRGVLLTHFFYGTAEAVELNDLPCVVLISFVKFFIDLIIKFMNLR